MDIATVSKSMIAAGLGIALLGLLMLGLSKLTGPLPFGRLPGDLSYRSGNMSVYAPITSMLLLSVLLSGILWIIQYFRRG